VSGIFVAPAEIENCLLQHEAVLECAVIGYDPGDGLVKPKAFIVLREEFQIPNSKFQSSKFNFQSSISKVQSPAQSPDNVMDETEPTRDLTEELKDFVKSHLATYKYPRWIEFVASLPKNDRGKIDRRKLKSEPAA
jgi:benzoate-CoA ligase